MDIPDSYIDLMALPRNRYVEVNEGFDFQQIGFGLVFVLARWSGASILSFRSLNNVLATCDLPENLSVYIVDADNTPIVVRLVSMASHVPGHRGGYGETFVLRCGVVRCQLSTSDEQDTSEKLRTHIAECGHRLS